ncbi:MAG TPA: hypothetical protein VF395_15675 [Polyangiaceae bacterium]
MNRAPGRFSAAPTRSLFWGGAVPPLILATLVVACGASQGGPEHPNFGAGDPARAGAGASTSAATSAGGGAAGTPPVATTASVAPAVTEGAAEPAPESALGPAVPAVSPVAPASPELPRGTTVLHIGDSFAGALGIDLNVLFKAAGVRGILRYETATYIPTWAFGKQIDQYLGQFNPDLVIVTLGANELEIVNPADRTPTIHRLVARLRGRSCVWVGPPLWKGARPALLDTIKSECSPCLYLDSNVLLPDLPRTRDHIHPAMEARKTWARAVFGWLAEHRAAAAESAQNTRQDGVRPWDLTP